MYMLCPLLTPLYTPSLLPPPHHPSSGSVYNCSLIFSLPYLAFPTGPRTATFLPETTLWHEIWTFDTFISHPHSCLPSYPLPYPIWILLRMMDGWAGGGGGMSIPLLVPLHGMPGSSLCCTCLAWQQHNVWRCSNGGQGQGHICVACGTDKAGMARRGAALGWLWQHALL